MARLFGGVNTDKINLGVGAPYDNLAVNGGLTWIGTFLRNSNSNNQYPISKASATTGGWEIICGFRSPGTEAGHLRGIVWTSVTRYDVTAGSADGIAVAPINTQMIGGMTFSGSALKLYQVPLETGVITEVPSYTNGTTPSGTPGTDTAANLYIGNVVRGGPFPWNGALGFNLLYKRAAGAILTIAEMRKCQTGIQWYLAGLEEIARGGAEAVAGAATIARAVALWRSITGYVLLSYAYTNGSGNAELIDYVANANGTVIGTPTGTAAATDSVGWFAPLTFEDNVETTLSDQIAFRYTSDFSRFGITTPATSVTTFWQLTLDPATYTAQALPAYSIDGAASVKMPSATLNDLNVANVSGLSASSKVINFINGVRSHVDGVPAPYQGSFITAIWANAASTKYVPAAKSKKLVVIGDSVFAEGYLGDHPQLTAPSQYIRRNLPSWLDGVVSDSSGGNEYRDYCVDAPTRAASIARSIDASTKAVIIALGANDKSRNHWTAATAQPNIVAWLNGILAISSTLKIWILSTPPLTDVSANGLGDTHATWRTMESGLPAATSAPSRVQFIDTSGWYLASVTLDGAHPPTATYTGTINPNIAALLTTDPFPSVGGKWSGVMRGRRRRLG